LSTPDRRRAERVPVSLPAQLYSTQGFLDAQVGDLSRTGLRLQVPARRLGVDPAGGLRAAAEAIARALGPSFAMDLDYRKLGPLLQRTVHLTRLTLPPGDPPRVEFCCAFDKALGDEEAAFLGQELPPVREDVPEWLPTEDVLGACLGTATLRPEGELREVPSASRKGPPTAIRPRQRYRALVTGSAIHAPPAFFCHTDLVTAVGVRIRIPRPPAIGGAGAILARLVKQLGPTVELRILGEKGDVWSGTARLSGVETPPERPDVLLVTLAFATSLSLSDLRRLGLVAAIA
jgi:hypothetical protein